MSAPVQKPPDNFLPRDRVPQPVMKVNGYDRISAGMISLVMGLCVGVVCAVAYWLSTRPSKPVFLTPMEMVEVSGGFEDGNPNESLQVESPEDPSVNPSTAEEQLDEPEVAETVDNVVELAESATVQAQRVQGEMFVNSGVPGSARGKGGRPLGMGGGAGGVPSEQRWFVQFADEAALVDYARQLDYFGIELGALMPDGELIYLSKVSSNTPLKRTTRDGKSEQRLYMTWQGGQRKQADYKLFERVGMNVSQAVLFHFYPPATEQMLLQREYEYKQRKASDIRRTYFAVIGRGNSWDLTVVRQIYLK